MSSEAQSGGEQVEGEQQKEERGTKRPREEGYDRDRRERGGGVCIHPGRREINILLLLFKQLLLHRSCARCVV